ncbi:MAG TPA: phage holin family protein [Acidimicrobiia bacterium]|jgi:putative membrane protein|nr:phage holin family protein [Acidimicrobiia bacterium]
MRFLIKLAVTALAVWIAFTYVPGLDFTGSFWNLVVVAILVALVNAIVKPLMNLFSLPIVILTLGLFLLITNALALQLVIWLSGLMDLGLSSTGFFWATFWGAVVISVVRWAADWFIPDER